MEPTKAASTTEQQKADDGSTSAPGTAPRTLPARLENYRNARQPKISKGMLAVGVLAAAVALLAALR
ncbi:hypothetical protein J7E62_14280 [Variovorax paradoxus]|nr:hypothetical protein [Variovorax paradoxus]